MSTATRRAVLHLVNDEAPQAFVVMIEAVEEETRRAGVPLPYLSAGPGFRRLIAHRRTRHLRRAVAS